MSFLDLIFNYEKLLNNGYNTNFLKEFTHILVNALFPFFMTALAAMITMNTLKS